MDKSTVSRAIHRTVIALNNYYFQNTVKWPDTEDSRRQIAQQFYDRGGMPSVAGAIDGSHIPIERPKDSEFQYVNRKGFYSINALVVSGSDHYIYYINARWPGSVNDSRVLRNSSLFQTFENGW